MRFRIGTLASAGVAMLLFLCLLLIAGCNKGQEGGGDTSSAGAPGSGGAGSPGAMMGGPGRMGGSGGGRGGPVAANATGEEIYQAKCGCHGPGGKGGRAPVLTGSAGKSEDELAKIIHDGKGRMPAFGAQLTDDQIKKVASTVKAFK